MKSERALVAVPPLELHDDVSAGLPVEIVRLLAQDEVLKRLYLGPL